MKLSEIKKRLKTGCLFIGLSMALSLVSVGAQEMDVEVLQEETDQEENRVEDDALGISYLFSEEMNEAGLIVYRRNYIGPGNPGILNIREGESELYYILVYPEEEYQKEAEMDHWATKFVIQTPETKYKEETNGDQHYTYLDLTETINPEDYEEEEQESLKQAIDLCKELIDSVDYFDTELGVLDFEAMNLDGETVTGDLFHEKKITVLNVWATYCNPCINEMPKLAEWEKELGDEAQILYLCGDILPDDVEKIDLANLIVDKSGVNRKNVIYNMTGSCKAILGQVTGVPTTFFIDENGKLLEDIVVGAYVENYKEIVERYLEEIA